MKTKEQTLENIYPNIAQWVQDNTIEVGVEYYKKGIVARALDEGGVVWEGEGFRDFESVMKALDKGIEAWCEEQGI